MKKITPLVIFLFNLGYFVSAQTTLTIRPNSSIGKDAYIEDYHTTTNYGSYPNFAAIAWTGLGNSFVSRSLIQFDYSSLPGNAVIIDARLNLYCNTTSDHPQLHSGSNACYLQRITSTWSENTVNWLNQPSTTTVNQVFLAQSISQTQDYLNIDVKTLVLDMINNPSTSFGFLIKLQTETIYRSLIFANSDHADSAKWPMLIITYTIPPPCINSIVLKPNATQGKDAYIESYNTTTNYGNYPNFAAIAWTGLGNSFVSRSLIQFDYSSLPGNAIITDARLDLYCNTTSDHPQLHSGSNACYLQRITSTWSENSVNWLNQPSTTTLNQVSLAQSISQTQDYLNIDVKNLVLDMMSNPTSSFGFLIKLQTEATYRSLIFANSDHADSTKWPRLVICYTLPAEGIAEFVDNSSINIFPNPSTGNFTIKYENNFIPYSVKIFNINGQLIEQKTNVIINELLIINNHIINNKGIYFIEIENGGSVYRRKIAIL